MVLFCYVLPFVATSPVNLQHFSFETIKLCFSFWLPVGYGWDTVQHRPPWPPPMQCEVQVDDIRLRPTPWPSFSSLAMVIQWAIVLSRMLCYSVSLCMMKLHFQNISGYYLRQWFESIKTTLLLDGFVGELAVSLFQAHHDASTELGLYFLFMGVNFSTWSNTTTMIPAADSLLCNSWLVFKKQDLSTHEANFLVHLSGFYVVLTLDEYCKNSMFNFEIHICPWSLPTRERIIQMQIKFDIQSKALMLDHQFLQYICIFTIVENSVLMKFVFSKDGMLLSCGVKFSAKHQVVITASPFSAKLTTLDVVMGCSTKHILIPGVHQVKLTHHGLSNFDECNGSLPHFKEGISGCNANGSKEMPELGISLALHCYTNSSSTDDQQWFFSIGQIRDESGLLILLSYSILLQSWSILLDTHCSLNIDLVPLSSSILLIHYVLTQKHTNGSRGYNPGGLFHLSFVSCHWTKVQVIERLYPLTTIEYLFRSQGFLVSAVSFVESKVKHVTSIEYLQVPWDPGEIDLIHRLGGKLNFKKGGNVRYVSMDRLPGGANCHLLVTCYQKQYESAMVFGLHTSKRPASACVHLLGLGPCSSLYSLLPQEEGEDQFIMYELVAHF